MEKKLLLKIFRHQTDKLLNIKGAELCKLTEKQLIELIFNENENIKIGTIRILYKRILHEMDEYVFTQRIKLFNASYSKIIKIWKHVIQNTEKCNKGKCKPILRTKQRERYLHRDVNE